MNIERVARRTLLLLILPLVPLFAFLTWTSIGARLREWERVWVGTTGRARLK